LYSALRENTANALNETQCHSNRCVFIFKSRRNWSDPTAGSRKLSGVRHVRYAPSAGGRDHSVPQFLGSLLFVRTIFDANLTW